MFLCVQLECGFGREYIADKFLLMMPDKGRCQAPGGRSLIPLYNPVKKIISVSEESNGIKNGDAMVVD
jgi:hypothetical protein